MLNALALFFILSLDNDLALSAMKAELRQQQRWRASELRTSTVRTYMDMDVKLPGSGGGPPPSTSDPLAVYPAATMRVIAPLPVVITYINISILLAGSLYYALHAKLAELMIH